MAVQLEIQVWCELGILIEIAKNLLTCFSGPDGPCTVNKAEMIALRMGLHEANHLGLHRLLVERESIYTITLGQWEVQSS